MYRQWAQAKRDHPDVLMLFRMGDFYEMFDEDARIGSEALGLTLTSRKHKGDQKIAMCGVPHHALDRYLRQLVQKGYRAAICEQVQDPREAKGLVKRQVTRVVTPGTLMEDELLQGQEHNFLLSVALVDEQAGIAVVDVSTGDFLVTEIALRQPEPRAATALEGTVQPQDGRLNPVSDEIARLQPAEVVVSEPVSDQPGLSEAAAAAGGAHLTVVQEDDLEFRGPEQQLTEFFHVDSLRGYGCHEMPAAQKAAAQALKYLQQNRLDSLPQLSGITTYSTKQFMVIDAATRRNLELVRTIRQGAREGSLLALLDRTRTPMGARMLRQWLLQPLLDIGHIQQRLDSVEALVGNGVMAGELREALRGVRDLERLTNRVTAGTANARDVAALGASIGGLPQVRASLADAVDVPLLAGLREGIDELGDVAQLVERAIADEPATIITEGGIIRNGFSEQLDELREAMNHGRDWIARLQDQERRQTGIEKLKVGYNKVFGYYIEVTKPHLDLVPERYQRKQTLVNAERFVTPELKERESRILTAEEDTVRMEREHFERIREKVGAAAARVQEAARATATADALLSFARVSVDHRYTRPLVDDSAAIEIREGRHPVVERLLEGDAFVPNDTEIDTEARQILLITGPNMAGKSTYLRQVGLVVIMAQIGCFVPARSARIGVVDRIFTRIGATDALARGRSTFLVEMGETANILHNATSRSLILLDEIGRGTSTFDGLSIAWAVTEYLHRSEEARPKTLFATHYHELTELEELLPRLRNMNVLVRETEDSIVFLRKVVPGAADQSYGIEVAKLAGMPPEVIVRAREILGNLEESQYTAEARPRLAGGSHGPLGSDEDQLTLFGGVPSEVEREIDDLELTTMTPIEAIEKLDELQRRVRRGKQDPDTP